MTYIEGLVVPVPADSKEAYLKSARDAAPPFREQGALEIVECWAEDVPHGKVTDFYRAVGAKDGETVVFSWVVWPSREVRDAGNSKLMADPRFQPGPHIPFDMQRMIYGGFTPIVAEGSGDGAGYVDGFVLPLKADDREAYRAWAAKAAPIFREHGALRTVEAYEDNVPDGKVTDYHRAVQAGEDEKVVFSWIEWPSKAARDAGWEKAMADPRMPPDDEMPIDGQRMFWGGFTPILQHGEPAVIEVDAREPIVPDLKFA
jgi:uncharacterized protein YbaA (DUF1428 family)